MKKICFVILFLCSLGNTKNLQRAIDKHDKAFHFGVSACSYLMIHRTQDYLFESWPIWMKRTVAFSGTMLLGLSKEIYDMNIELNIGSFENFRILVCCAIISHIIGFTVVYGTLIIYLDYF